MLTEIFAFTIFIWRLKFVNSNHIEDQLKKYGFRDRYLQNQFEKVNQMHFIIKWFLFLYSITTLFSLISYEWANYKLKYYNNLDPDGKKQWLSEKQDTCNVVTNNHKVDTWLWLVQNLVNWLLWQYPVMFIFWPVEGLCCCKNKASGHVPESILSQEKIFIESVYSRHTSEAG